MGTCEENVVQLRPNFRVTNASALWPLGEAGSQGGAVWVVVRTRLKRNMWKHSRSTYLGGTRLSHSQLATAPLWGEGSFVCVIMMKWFLRTTAVVGNTCDRAHFYKGIYFHFRMCKRICLVFFLTCYILSILSPVMGWKTTTLGLLEGVAQLYPTDPCSGTFHSYEPHVLKSEILTLLQGSAYRQCCSIGLQRTGDCRWRWPQRVWWGGGGCLQPHELQVNWMETSKPWWRPAAAGPWTWEDSEGGEEGKFSKSQRGLKRR